MPHACSILIWHEYEYKTQFFFHILLLSLFWLTANITLYFYTHNVHLFNVIYIHITHTHTHIYISNDNTYIAQAHSIVMCRVSEANIGPSLYIDEWLTIYITILHFGLYSIFCLSFIILRNGNFPSWSFVCLRPWGLLHWVSNFFSLSLFNKLLLSSLLSLWRHTQIKLDLMVCS